MSGSPSINNMKGKRKKIAFDDSNLKNLSNSKDNRACLLKHYEKLRPTTAVASKSKKNRDLLTPLDHLSMPTSNYILTEE